MNLTIVLLRVVRALLCILALFASIYLAGITVISSTVTAGFLGLFTVFFFLLAGLIIVLELPSRRLRGAILSIGSGICVMLLFAQLGLYEFIDHDPLKTYLLMMSSLIWGFTFALSFAFLIHTPFPYARVE